MKSDSELLQLWSPRLIYDSRERFYADAASSLVENRFQGGPSLPYATRLCMSDGSEIASADGDLNLGFLCGAECYSTGQKIHDTDYLDPGDEAVADARRLHRRHGNRIYGHIAQGKAGRRWLQYWFFYFFNSKGLPRVRSADGLFGFGLHDGDWEMVQFGLRGEAEEPDIATFAAHNHGHSVSWQEIEKDKDGVPKVYVALGSHASYPRAGKWRGGRINVRTLDDWCDGEGDRRRPKVIEIEDDEPSWIAWPGRWGATEQLFDGPGSGSPQGPAFQRKKWVTPDKFHSEAPDWRDAFLGSPFEEVGAELPEIQVRVKREGARWVASFEVPPDLEQQWRGVLILAINSPAAAPPEVRTFDLNELAEREVKPAPSSPVQR
jgi:hypothetical protein